MRAVVGQKSLIRIQVEDAFGAPVVDADVTVDVTNVDGELVLTDAVAEAGTLDGQYQLLWTPEEVGEYTVNWTATLLTDTQTGQEWVDVVYRRSQPLSGLLVVPGIAGKTLFEQLDAIDAAESAIEDAVMFGLVQHKTRFTFRLTKTLNSLRISRGYATEVLAISRDGEVLDPSAIEIVDNCLTMPSASSVSFLDGYGYMGSFLPGKYVVDLRHGMPTTPGDLQAAVRVLARNLLLSGEERGYSDRASRFMQAETEIWLSRPGVGTHFGIPEVDTTVERYKLNPCIANEYVF